MNFLLIFECRAQEENAELPVHPLLESPVQWVVLVSVGLQVMVKMEPGENPVCLVRAGLTDLRDHRELLELKESVIRAIACRISPLM